jgi:hypothetical protein
MSISNSVHARVIYFGRAITDLERSETSYMYWNLSHLLYDINLYTLNLWIIHS